MIAAMRFSGRRAFRRTASASVTPPRAALARGQSTTEIVGDCPPLTAEQVAAVGYAKLCPRTGRPPPVRSFRRMLADLAAAGVWDLENEPPPVEPRLIP
jgi:hypothetical protein